MARRLDDCRPHAGRPVVPVRHIRADGAVADFTRPEATMQLGRWFAVALATWLAQLGRLTRVLLVAAGDGLVAAAHEAVEAIGIIVAEGRRRWPQVWRAVLSRAAVVRDGRKRRCAPVLAPAGDLSRSSGRARVRRLGVRLMALSAVTSAAAVMTALVAVPVVRAGAGAIVGSVVATPEPAVLPPLPQRSIVFAADGRPTAVLYRGVDRQAVTLAEVAPVAVTAVVDTEDARFWTHGGVDPHAVMRAALRDLGSGSSQQGGSTIAQQLVKNTMLTPRRDVQRKITEMVLADRIERRYGRRAVLERYLNTVYFGESAYGIEAAAEIYFGVTASALGPAQAALLAGLIHDPVGDDPIHNPAAARLRRRAVLQLLVTHHHLTPAAAAQADQARLPSSVNRPATGQDYFTDAVRQELLRDPRLGATRADRQRALEAGGLRIHTALDPRLEQEAAAAVSSGLPQAGMPLDAAVAAVDPATGAVRAVVGGPSYTASQFDPAVAAPGRQSGSSFKVFTLIAALEGGYSPSDVIDGSTPCSIPNPGGSPNPWTPSNFEGEAFGPITLTTATAKSVNCAYARLALMVGLPKIASVAHAMGITARLATVPSMTLGTNDVTPLQEASAYATIAADGVYRAPHFVEEVDRPDGSVLLRNAPPGHQVIPAQIAREATQVLQQVVTAGTGQAAALPGRPVAGKTGTTQDYQDAWFVGYTPQLSTAVWMGDPHADVPMTGVGGINVVGGSYPAQIWHTFMNQALAPLPAAGFPAPDPSAVPPATNRTTQGPPSQTRITTWCWSSCGH